MHEIVPDTLPREGAVPLGAALRVGTKLAHGRLHILGALGRGGMGTVYRAYDSVRQGQVALKTMNRLDAVGIYALKNEFRTLQDVHHPNLVQLFELFREDDQWFFTMDLVVGCPFDKWVRPDDRLDERRLRSAFGQLVDA